MKKTFHSLLQKFELNGKLLVGDFLEVFNPNPISRFSKVIPCLYTSSAEIKLEDVNNYNLMLNTSNILYKYCIENNIYVQDNSFDFIKINSKIYIEINKSILTKETNSDFLWSYIMCSGDYVLIGDSTVTVKCCVLDEVLSGRFKEMLNFEKQKGGIEQKTYIMFDSNTGYHKIGKSINITIRERTLQSEKPTVKLVLTCEENIESYLHKKHSKKRVRGEWFDLKADDLLELIEVYNFKKV